MEIELKLEREYRTTPKFQYPTVLRAIRARASARKYGNGVPLDVLAEAMAKVSYKGLDLSHLHHGL